MHYRPHTKTRWATNQNDEDQMIRTKGTIVSASYTNAWTRRARFAQCKDEFGYKQEGQKQSGVQEDPFQDWMTVLDVHSKAKISGRGVRKEFKWEKRAIVLRNV